MTLEAAKTLYTALTSTGYTVTQVPVMGTEAVYLSFDLVAGVPVMHGSDKMLRASVSYYVHIWARTQPEEAFDTTVSALKAAGIRVQSWGAGEYETDTGWHHMPILVAVSEIM